MLSNKTQIGDLRVVWLTVAVLLAMSVGSVRADFTFGQPVNLGSPINSQYDDYMPYLSPDGLEMYFCSNRPGGQGGYDIWVTKRAAVQDVWGPPTNLGPQINSANWEDPGTLSADGLTLYFGVGNTVAIMYTSTRAAKDAPWGPPVKFSPTVNMPGYDVLPVVSPDELELFFTSARPGGYGDMDVWVTTRAAKSDPWGAPLNLGPTVNTPYLDSGCISPDGRMLLLYSNRSGGFGGYDVWMTTRASKGSPWSPARNLGPSFNTIYAEGISSISPDGRSCYFHDWFGPRPGGMGGSDIWEASISPITDFNGDGTVDAADMTILEANWGKKGTSCDIGPFPWGDGMVDEKDLAVLMESLMTPGPKASDVVCNIVLSWVGPSFAESYDVYFGTSLNDVSDATREDPCGVLVSEGQVETAYDPNGLLEFSKTYYWRVDVIDVVAGASEPVIYRGSVLSFTTEDYAYPIQNITATASSRERGMEPEKTVDGSGLDANDGHSTKQTDMWLSKNAGPHWIQYEFDQIYALNELWVWNSNQLVEPFMGFGAKTVKVEYSTDGATWTVLEGVPEFARAPGQTGYLHNTFVSFNGVSAKYVKLTIEKGWGTAPAVGLSEVRFFYIPDRR